MGIPVATVTSGGRVLDPSFELMRLEIRRELNRIPQAELTLLDGSVAERKFAISDSGFFAPGKSIRIALRYEGETPDVTLFEGLVVRHAVQTDGDGSLLRVELKDAAFRLTRQRRSAVFRKQSDAEAIAKLIRASGLEVGVLAATPVKHDELVQYCASDWDFIVARAEAQGLVVDVAAGTISVRPLALAAPKGMLEYGSNACELSLELDASEQYAQLSSVGWDLPAHELSKPFRASAPRLGAGNQDPGAIAARLGGEQHTLFQAAGAPADELASWADARMLRSRFAFLRGRALVSGDPAWAPLDAVEISGVGDSFNGAVLVSGVTHKLDHDGWYTELHFGMAPEWFMQKPEVTPLPAAGMLPWVHGLQIATVAAYEPDPLGEHRIKLKLPALDAAQGFVWARWARPDAGKDRGFVFWPEPGDEVVVAFLDGDPRQPVVLGALHGKPTLEAPLAPSEQNDKRQLRSRSGVTLGFDDARRALTLSTPAGNTIEIDDEHKTITIADCHGNALTLSDQGIAIKSHDQLTLEAAGKVAIKGASVDVQ